MYCCITERITTSELSVATSKVAAQKVRVTGTLTPLQDDQGESMTATNSPFALAIVRRDPSELPALSMRGVRPLE